MYTNTTRITGLSGSGIDTDSMIEKLMYAESSKLFRYQRNVTWKTWQQEAYRNIISKIDTFQNKWISSIGTSTSLKYSSAFSSFKNSVKTSDGDESKAITINSSSSSKKYSISVEKLATTDTYVSGMTKSKTIEGTVNTSDLVSRLNETGGEFSMKLSLDGKSKTITINKADFDSAAGSSDEQKIQNALNEKIEKAFGTEKGGPKASFSIGADGKFSLTGLLGHEVKAEGAGTNSKSVFTSSVSEPNAAATGTIKVKVDGVEYNVTIDSNTKGDTIADKINNALEKAEAGGTTKDLQGALKASIKDNKLVLSAGTSPVEITDVSGADLQGMFGGTSLSLEGSNDLNNFFGITNGSNKISNSTTLEEIFGSKDDTNGGIWDTNGEASITINDTEIKFTKDTNFSTFLSKINTSDAGVKISYNNTSQKFTIEAAESGAANKISFGMSEGKTTDVLSVMGFSVTGGAIDASQHKETAADAELTIDGVPTTRTSNTIDLDGMNITLNKVTDGETLDLSNETDVDAIYENITKFVEEYNTLIGDITKPVKETRAKSDDYSYYEPLTDQQKKEMEEDEIKLWEEKAKTGLLYRDSSLTTLLGNLRSNIYASVTKDDGTKLALFNFGITTSSDMNKPGQLVIDEEKLKKALSENLDDVQTLFTGNGTKEGKGIIENIEAVMKAAIGTNGSLREKAGIANTASANENTLSKQIKEINEKISLEKERLVREENRYYMLFSSMESSITNSNSQLDALFSMLGS